jgi:hypothetical protein
LLIFFFIIFFLYTFAMTSLAELAARDGRLVPGEEEVRSAVATALHAE